MIQIGFCLQVAKTPTYSVFCWYSLCCTMWLQSTNITGRWMACLWH